MALEAAALVAERNGLVQQLNGCAPGERKQEFTQQMQQVFINKECHDGVIERIRDLLD